MQIGLIAIGISNYSGNLRRLPGALNGARDLYDWAPPSYQKLLITDKDDPVDVARLRNEVSQFLNTNEFDRLIIYFSGHGFARAAADQYWLLPNIYEDPDEAINIAVFERQVQKWDIPQISIIADACRNTGDLAFEIHGSSILRNGNPVNRNVERDHFLATSLGNPAFSITHDNDSEAYCIFTSVLLEALKGKHRDAFNSDSHPEEPAIISKSLGKFLETEVSLRANNFSEEMVPEIKYGFGHPKDVYVSGLNLPTITPLHIQETKRVFC